MQAWLLELIEEWRTKTPVKRLLEEVAYEGRSSDSETPPSFRTNYLDPYHEASSLM